MAGSDAKRSTALDSLRGLAVAGMILVVSPGDWSHTYAELQHAAWDGWTLADMVFPTFLFGVGAALGLSFPRAWDRPAQRVFGIRLLRRVVTLIALGLLVEATYVWAIAAGAPYPGAGGLDHARLPGILQRIGLCYGMAAVIVVGIAGRVGGGRLTLRPAMLALATAGILVAYQLLLSSVPVPGIGAGHLDPAGNLGAYIDRRLFGVAHLWPLGRAVPDGPVVYDPEGLLSSLPATANVLIGVLATTLLRSERRRGTAMVLAGGAALFAAGVLLDPLVPVNKRLWTSSFALLSGGFSAMLLAALTVATRGAAAERLLTPLRVLGGNAILAFLLSTLLSRIAGFPLKPAPSLQEREYAFVQRVVSDPFLASLACALGIVALVMALLWPLHRRALHFRL